MLIVTLFPSPFVLYNVPFTVDCMITVLCSFRINYYIAGGLHPTGFHVLNITLHGIVCVLLLWTVSLLIGGVQYGQDGQKLFASPKASLLVALLFAVHPIHTESVSAVNFTIPVNI